MLVLTRHAGESILIGDDIVVTPLAMDRGQFRIAISAPASVHIHREEIYQNILKENGATKIAGIPTINTGKEVNGDA